MRVTDEQTAKSFVAERCDSDAFLRLHTFVEMLHRANERQNLVSPASLEAVWARHVADSAQLLDHVSRETRGPWVDLGSGAGFPGLVVGIMRPATPLVMIESRRLRIEWLLEVIERLRLTECRVEGADVRKVPALSAGVISARAFAPLPRLVALAARFSTKDTRWVLPKGRSAAQEVADLPEESRMFHVKPSVTDPQAGIVVGTGQIEAAPCLR